MPTITLLYAGLLGVISIVLVVGVGRGRQASGISLGLGEDKALLVANRRHGNFVEYVPLALILMGLLEANGINTIALHVFGITLTLSRILHPLGLRADEVHPFRVIGTAGTLLVILAMSLWSIARFFIS